MKKYLISFLAILAMNALHGQTLLADRYEEANKHYMEAYNLYRVGKVEESLELLKKVIEIDPDHAEAYFGMGSVYFRLGRFEEAVGAFNKVISIKPEYAQAFERLWLAYKRMGMEDKANEALQSYRRIIAERMKTTNGRTSQTSGQQAAQTPQEAQRTAESRSPERRTETPQQAETRPSAASVPGDRDAASRPQTTETRAERPATSVQERSAGTSVRTPQPSPAVTRPAETTRPAQTARQPAVSPGTEQRPSPVRAERSSTKSRSIFKPVKSLYYRSTGTLKGSHLFRFVAGFIYYVMIIQVWLCIVASFFLYFRKAKLQRDEH
ncbi:MAG: tetratricopeptide repeat protein [Candidatus Loosdrechtia sp.]|uniref:tetratricopeptide repeat protein n=1 Tax=Candidatus Loosdrechtia sp. TaxID=3101272 RepID=UPI003A652AF9|nr:MAG: tetratricopeptide repeat protein [Candidatus Jettenia sp. AMX2]